MTVSALGSLRGPPIAALVPPGVCQFGEDFVPATLVEKVQVSPTSSLLRFTLPDPDRPLGLSTCACLLVGVPIGGEQLVRPYTPVSTNALVGHLDLLVKNYPETGAVSKYLTEDLEVGSSAVQFKHIPFNVKIQAPVLMAAGGSGITPMIQALHALLGGTGRTPKITLLYGSKDAEDILGHRLLDGWVQTHGDQLEVVHVLSSSAEEAPLSMRRGHVDRALLEEFLPLPRPDPNAMVLVCGPPPMYEALCGPRDDPDHISGFLGEMGYTPDQVYKF